MNSKVWTFAALAAGTLLAGASAAAAGELADVLCYYERGMYVAEVYGSEPLEYYDDPTLALIEPGYVSLGQWSDDPAADNGYPVGLMLGFSYQVEDLPGPDLKIVGNAWGTPENPFREPAFVEVARETSGGGATPDGWMDETFYLIRPSNYALLSGGDPRDAPSTLGWSYDAQTWQYTYTDPAWQSPDVTGYGDHSLGGDLLDLGDAIDAAGHPVALAEISYVRLRTVSNDDLGMFGRLNAEVSYVEAVHVPEPGSLALLFSAAACLLWAIRRRGGRGRRQ